jgi:hypothetical protein
MQKVVTVYLVSWQFQHLRTEELLSQYLDAGWRITSTTAAGCGAEHQGNGAWVIFVLEK